MYLYHKPVVIGLKKTPYIFMGTTLYGLIIFLPTGASQGMEDGMIDDDC